MAEHIRWAGGRMTAGRARLGELIHTAVRRAIEVAVDVELTTALGAPRYARCGSRCGYRNGTKPRTLTGPTGPLALQPELHRYRTTHDWAANVRLHLRAAKVLAAVEAGVFPPRCWAWGEDEAAHRGESRCRPDSRCIDSWTMARTA